MSWSNGIEQSPWEETRDNNRKKELIKDLSKARASKTADKQIDGEGAKLDIGRSAPQPEKSEMQKIWENQSLN